RTLRLLRGARRNRRPVPSRRPRHRKGAYQGFRPPEYMNSPRPSAVVVTFQLFTVRRYIACGTPRRTLTAKIHLGRGMWHGALPRRTAAWNFFSGMSLPLTAQVRRKCGAGAGGDRKSTRLNSSHVKISYAVFCLKKKK